MPRGTKRKTGIPDPRKPHERLSFMQYACAVRLVRGLSEHKTAQELNIHHSSVSKHKKRLFANMGITSPKELKAYAKEHGVFK